MVACVRPSYFSYEYSSSSSSRSIAELDPWFILASAYWSDVVLTSVNVCPLLGSPLVVTLTSQLTGRGPKCCTVVYLTPSLCLRSSLGNHRLQRYVVPASADSIARVPLSEARLSFDYPYLPMLSSSPSCFLAWRAMCTTQHSQHSYSLRIKMDSITRRLLASVEQFKS